MGDVTNAFAKFKTDINNMERRYKTMQFQDIFPEYIVNGISSVERKSCNAISFINSIHG
ncbi:hypothetical protein KKH82_07510 [Patescibacteria group bacterium]|nr:hypothetical protein [Patescibacteria group bacterium]